MRTGRSMKVNRKIGHDFCTTGVPLLCARCRRGRVCFGFLVSIAKSRRISDVFELLFEMDSVLSFPGSPLGIRSENRASKVDANHRHARQLSLFIGDRRRLGCFPIRSSLARIDASGLWVARRPEKRGKMIVSEEWKERPHDGRLIDRVEWMDSRMKCLLLVQTSRCFGRPTAMNGSLHIRRRSPCVWSRDGERCLSSGWSSFG